MQQEVDLPAQSVERRNWVSRLDIGEAGARQGGAIKFRAGLLGCVARGSLGYLKPGRYRLVLGIRSRPNRSPGSDAGILIELITCSRLISVHVLTSAELRNTNHELLFGVPEQPTVVEVRISAISSVEATIHDVAVASLGGPPEKPLSKAVRLQNWLPLLDVGPAGKRPEFGAEAEQGITEALERRSGCVICGPRWPLPPGSYSMTAVIEPSAADSHAGAIGRLDVAADTTPIASAEIEANQAVQHPVVLPFEVARPASNGFPPLIEFRVFSNGTGAFRMRSVKVEPQQPASTSGARPGFGNLRSRTKALLSRPFERATARSVGPLVATLEATIAKKIEQIEALQHTLAKQQREAGEGIDRTLERLEGQACPLERAIQAVAEQQREGDEWLERTLERIERQTFRQEQAIQAAAKQQRAVGETLGRRLEGLEGQASRQEQAIQAVAEQKRAVDEALGRLEGLEGQASRQEQAIQAVADQQRAAGEGLGRRLEGLEGQASRQEQAIQAVADQQRAAGEGLGRRLEGLEGQASRQEQAIQAVAEQQRAVGEALGRRLEGLEGQASRQEEAIEAVTEQQREKDDWFGRTLERVEAQASRQQQAIQVMAKQQLATGEKLGRRLEQLEGQASRHEQAIQALSRSINERLDR